MRKFKRVFYPIYIVFSLGFLYLSIDSLINMEDQMVWFSEKFSANSQPFWIMSFVMILAILMTVEIIAENIHIHRVKEGIDELQDEILRLKARLYDQDEGEEGEEDQDEDDEDEP